MDQKLLSIGDAAQKLGISIDTLRRWDRSGKLKSIRITPTGNRLYRSADIDALLKNIVRIAEGWAEAHTPPPLDSEYLCQTSDLFKVRLEKFQQACSRFESLSADPSLLVAMTGEIGNNSFDHNLGNWTDVPGVFFSYSLIEKTVALADRGQGILASLKRIRPTLSTHSEALHVAFTEVISGRSPEQRGNGLKFVRNIVTQYPFKLIFRTGNATLTLRQGDSKLMITETTQSIPGCFAHLSFS